MSKVMKLLQLSLGLLMSGTVIGMDMASTTLPTTPLAVTPTALRQQQRTLLQLALLQAAAPAPKDGGLTLVVPPHGAILDNSGLTRALADSAGTPHTSA